jgi:hypothetical protein
MWLIIYHLAKFYPVHFPQYVYNGFCTKQGLYNMDRCIIQVMHVTDKGIPMGGWQDMHHLNNATSQIITYEMQQAKQRMRSVRVRAVDQNGRMIDMIP